MLSQAEIEFLKYPQNFNANYSKALRFRLRGKITLLRDELTLLERAGFTVTENSNQVMETCNRKSKLKSGCFSNLGAEDGIRTHAERMFHGLSRPAR
jgi:hypothetical protein